MKSIIKLSLAKLSLAKQGLTALLLILTSINCYSADIVIVEGFDIGCNPCQGKTQNGKTFELSFKLNNNYVEQITIDGKAFNIKGGEEIYSDSFPPLAKVEFKDSSQTDIYAVKASSGSYNSNYHYFIYDGKNKKTNWHYLGQYPNLKYDEKTKSYSSSMRAGPNVDQQYYQLENNQLKPITKP